MSTAAPPTPAAPGRPGRGVTATWWYTWLSVAFLFVLFTATAGAWIAADETAPIPLRAAVLALFALATAASINHFRHARPGLWAGHGALRSAAVLMIPAALAYAVSLGHPSWRALGALPIVTALSVLAAERPRGWCASLMVGIAVAVIGHYWVATALAESLGAGVSSEQAQAWEPMLRYAVFYALGCPFMVLLSLWFWTVVLRLDDARVVETELAVARERLRFAADLHDIQGHHLQVIALKTELAERLLDRDPVAARTQLRETRAAAREALEETRGLVQGLRQVSLGEELENAADVLGAAGIACERRAQAEPRDPEVRRLLGLAVREATTNLLRHASPTTTSFVLTREAAGTVGEDGGTGAATGGDDAGTGPRWRLAIVNDGVVEHTDAPGVIGARGAPGTGTGLLGLRDRLEPLCGTVAAGGGDGRFRLEVVVPERRADSPSTTGTTGTPGTATTTSTGSTAADPAPAARTEETAA